MKLHKMGSLKASLAKEFSVFYAASQKNGIRLINKVNAMQAKLQEQLSPDDAEVILGRLPERIKAALIAHAAEIEYPIAATIEMAIASFLDTEALGFVDCKPGRGQ
jgi:hypothetical protein